jgi:carbon-monoxide dehydrogenase large subunit
VVDAFAHRGVTDMTMPHSAWRVYQQLQKSGLVLES